MRCPKCKSDKARRQEYIGVTCIICLNCGYDECAELEVYPEEKKSQKAKGRYSPYKTGGPKRKK